jgi:Glycosyl transferase family 11
MLVVDTANYIGNGWSIGNHFFQFATGYSYAKKTGRKMILPRHNIHPDCEFFQKPYVYNDWYASWSQCVQDIPAGEYAIYKEPQFSFREIPDVSYNTVMLEGYFQSPKYFASCKDEIKTLFTPTEEIKQMCLTKWGHLLLDDKKEMVLVHARRTDYLQPRNIAIHNPLPPSYYHNAFAEIKKHIANPFFILVSDDPSYWDSVTIPGPNTRINEANSAITLYFMTHFKNYIISNSTFAWWGAYLSKHREPLVLAPEKWFGPAGFQDYQDIYEPGWIKVGQV